MTFNVPEPIKPRTERPCLGCGCRTPSKDRMCRSCTHTYARAHEPRPEHDDFLHGLGRGRWVPADGIMRWVAA